MTVKTSVKIGDNKNMSVAAPQLSVVASGTDNTELSKLGVR